MRPGIENKYYIPVCTFSKAGCGKACAPKLSPRIIIFESEWMTRHELGILIDRFRSLGYNIFKDGADHIASKYFLLVEFFK